ncbi:MAG: MoaD/ThiS family protein [Clostridia bacterium]|nr:MoaD/ThiS family protein [Clostridia bacterium]
MIKVKIFGVLRTTIGFGYIEVNADTVQGVFEEISKVMQKNYYEYHARKEREKEDPKLKYKTPRNAALMPHKSLEFKDAIVYVSGERCMKKKMKLQGDEEIWLLSPAAGG